MVKSVVRTFLVWTILIISISNVFGFINLLLLSHRGDLYTQQEKGKDIILLSPNATVYEDPKQDLIYTGEENKYVPIFRKAIGLIYIHDFLIFYTKHLVREILSENIKDKKLSQKIINILIKKKYFDASFIREEVVKTIKVSKHQEVNVKKLLENWNSVRELFFHFIDELISSGVCQYDMKYPSYNYMRCSNDFNETHLKKRYSYFIINIAKKVIKDFYQENPVNFLGPLILEKLDIKTPFIATSAFDKIVLCEHHRILAAKYLKIPIAVNVVPSGTSFN